MKVEQSLRLAILEKRFCCAFQAKVDIRTQAIKGIEALVRLRDDEGVIQAPGTFINLAVELGLIDELTHLVLAEIVRSIDLINETFGPDTTISMNVAAKQACNRDFMRSLAQALTRGGGRIQSRRAVLDGAVIGVTNPKTIAIFVVILPQFSHPAAGNLTLQLLELGLIFPVIALVLDSGWAIAAGTLSQWLTRSPRRLGAIGGAGGLAMIGLGLSLAATGRKD